LNRKDVASVERVAVSIPAWLGDFLDTDCLEESDELVLAGRPFLVDGGILRARSLVSDAQAQTSQAFGFKWAKRDTFESEAMLGNARKWLIERYGDAEQASWWDDYGERPLLLDAGCGAGLSALELFGSRLRGVRYLGVDISSAVDVAATRFAERGLPGAFMQADVSDLPLSAGGVDVIFSEGVLHHTDSTEGSLRALARLLAPGGRFLFYVYRRKGPIREFSDDYIRDSIQEMAPQEAWNALMPLTKLGKALGDLDVEVDVPETIDLLQIPAGRINLQRLFYWHVFKAYYRLDYELSELNHINFDWYAPRNAHRQSENEVRAWCADAGLDIEREDVQEAGITVIARKPV
jgi:arsenite methyltransferase